jgi:hypothetical protein
MGALPDFTTKKSFSAGSLQRAGAAVFSKKQ